MGLPAPLIGRSNVCCVWGGVLGAGQVRGGQPAASPWISPSCSRDLEFSANLTWLWCHLGAPICASVLQGGFGILPAGVGYAPALAAQPQATRVLQARWGFGGPKLWSPNPWGGDVGMTPPFQSAAGKVLGISAPRPFWRAPPAPEKEVSGTERTTAVGQRGSLAQSRPGPQQTGCGSWGAGRLGTCPGSCSPLRAVSRLPRTCS